ncbi:hypothetical protein Tmar_0983 [Thermaerobacter marianensis DSM 12885]|uniref:Flagellar hook-length control protein-like C-terminal domain-containing protein n=2 Tax=Thermaerobacter marianensis TaxID=73919 RepID=E6SJN3_THEM7|nr:hypothetical protein Tmar_0983 [Thermaerobacter marianensis DSM 12885]
MATAHGDGRPVGVGVGSGMAARRLATPAALEARQTAVRGGQGSPAQAGAAEFFTVLLTQVQQTWAEGWSTRQGLVVADRAGDGWDPRPSEATAGRESARGRDEPGSWTWAAALAGTVGSPAAAHLPLPGAGAGGQGDRTASPGVPPERVTDSRAAGQAGQDAVTSSSRRPDQGDGADAGPGDVRGDEPAVRGGGRDLDGTGRLPSDAAEDPAGAARPPGGHTGRDPGGAGAPATGAGDHRGPAGSAAATSGSSGAAGGAAGTGPGEPGTPGTTARQATASGRHAGVTVPVPEVAPPAAAPAGTAGAPAMAGVASGGTEVTRAAPAAGMEMPPAPPAPAAPATASPEGPGAGDAGRSTAGAAVGDGPAPPGAGSVPGSEPGGRPLLGAANTGIATVPGMVPAAGAGSSPVPGTPGREGGGGMGTGAGGAAAAAGTAGPGGVSSPPLAGSTAAIRAAATVPGEAVGATGSGGGTQGMSNPVPGLASAGAGGPAAIGVGPGGPPAGGPAADAARWTAAVAQWIDSLEWHRAGDRHVLRLQLTPAHLGPLHVEVLGDGSSLAARITVFHPDTLALVHRHLDDLRQALVARGYQLTGLEVGLGGPGGQPGQPGAGGSGGYPTPPWRGGGPWTEDPASPARAGAGRRAEGGRRPQVPGAGRLDVRI